MNRCAPSAGLEPSHLSGSPRGPMTLSVTLAAETGEGRHVARLVVGGVLDRDGLSALVHLAHIGVRRGYRELVLDLQGLTDFPSALFSEVRKLADLAERSRCELRLSGLDAAIAAVIDAAGRDDVPSDDA